MSVVAVMLAKDESDVIGYALDHLEAQVDRVMVYDNGSTDGTREILEGRGVMVDSRAGYHYSEIVSAAARSLFGRYDWIVPVDADEAWVAPGGVRLGDWLDAADAGAASGVHLNHVVTLDDPGEENPLRRMRWRRAAPGWTKVAARITRDLTISWGAHAVTGTLPGAVGGISVHHFQWRSVEQAIGKIRRGIAAHKRLPANNNDQHWTRWEGRSDEEIAAWYYDDCCITSQPWPPWAVYDPVYA